MKPPVHVLIAMFIVSVGIAGCIDSSLPSEPQTQTPAQPGPTPSSEEPAMTDESNNRHAVIETDKGTITFELYEERAPVSTANFIKLAESGFYDDLVFHRVEPGFVIQTGDPTGTGRGGSDESIPLEIHPDLRHVEGAVGMARTNDPNSATSQFYITLDDVHQLDDNYAVFGRVTEGLDVAKKIEKGDTMVKVSIVGK